ncbi:MAG: hypothetical protein CVV10_09195, partial [Gammaproteobacteria bacterium HGW-Gammaproteobacteria-14]
MSRDNPARIIIADSSRLGSVMLERILAPLMDVEVCTDAAALDVALRQNPALLLVAHQWSGLELLLAGKSIPGVILMASPESDAARLASLSERFGAGIIYRPYEARQVMREILALLSSSERHVSAHAVSAIDTPQPEESAETVERDQAFCRRHHLPHTLLALRIDEHSELEKQLGKDALTQAEKQIAELISANLRREDHVCLQQPDKIVLSLPGTPVQGARVLAHRLCQKVHDLHLNGTDLNARFTILAGIHIILPQGDFNVSEALNQAQAICDLANTEDNLAVLLSEAACDQLERMAPPLLQSDNEIDNNANASWDSLEALLDASDGIE